MYTNIIHNDDICNYFLKNQQFIFNSLGNCRECRIEEALDYKDSQSNLVHKSIDVLQLPHHGSRKNVTPALIQRIMAKEYIISCPPNGLDSHHPSRRLVNMVLEKIPTAKIFKTADCSSFVFYYNFNWQLPYQTPMSAFDEIEDYD